MRIPFKCTDKLLTVVRTRWCLLSSGKLVCSSHFNTHFPQNCLLDLVDFPSMPTKCTTILVSKQNPRDMQATHTAGTLINKLTVQWKWDPILGNSRNKFYWISYSQKFYKLTTLSSHGLAQAVSCCHSYKDNE